MALGVGALFFGLGAALQFQYAAPSPRPSVYYSLLGTLLVTVATVIGTVGTGFLFKDFWLNLADRRRDKRFREFFGETAVSDSLRLVHALKKYEGDKMEFGSITAERRTRKDPQQASGTSVLPEGTRRWLCAEDNYAGTAISGVFFQKSSRFPRQVYDSFIEDDSLNFCTIGLGLGFNEFTHFLGAVTRGRMFNVVFKPSIKGDLKGAITDEFVVPIVENGEITWQIPRPSHDTDVALIVRVPVMQADDSPYFTLLLVAGRSAPGTAVAGAYLATYWERLHDFYADFPADLGKDSMILILEHKRSPNISGKDPNGVIIKSGARPYLGAFEKVNLTDLDSDYADCLKFDDEAQVRVLAESLRERGYGFYDANRVDRRRSEIEERCSSK